MTNRQFHDLCTTLNPPNGLRNLLGLGHKFCIQTGSPPDDCAETVRKLVRSVRIRHFMRTGTEPTDNQDEGYIPKLYVNSTWSPPLIDDNETELRLLDFANRLDTAVQRQAGRRKKFNLTHHQHEMIRKLKADRRFIVCLTDKNLGPAIIEREAYFDRIFADHLSDNTSYRRLTPAAATEAVEATRRSLIRTYNANQGHLTAAERTYFERSHKQQHRLPQFYVTFKVHKEELATRPVVSCIGSFNEIYSKWLDHQISGMLPLAPGWIKDTKAVITQCIRLGSLPSQARLFTADAVSMYTNICATHGIEVFTEWLNLSASELGLKIPRELFLAALRAVMQQNVFQLDDTHWLQLSGTAMGTSAACAYATMYYAYHERQTLLPKYKKELLYYGRFIDDIFGVWNGTQERFDEFKKDLAFGKLRWTTSKLVKQLEFLDLTISITDKGKLATRTYQKPLNLFLYLPPHSAHPPGVLRSLVFGNLSRFHEQNTNTKDYKQLVTEFAGHLIARGHDFEDLKPLFLEAAAKLDSPKPTIMQTSAPAATPPLILHWPYHPNGVPSAEIQRLYRQTLEGHTGAERLIIANSRPKNLRDALMRTRLNEPDGNRISQLYPASNNNNPPEAH